MFEMSDLLIFCLLFNLDPCD